MRLADGGVLDVPELVPRVRGRDQRQDQPGGRRPRQFAERDRDTAGDEPVPLPPGELLLVSSPLVDGMLAPDAAAWLV